MKAARVVVSRFRVCPITGCKEPPLITFFGRYGDIVLQGSVREGKLQLYAPVSCALGFSGLGPYVAPAVPNARAVVRQLMGWGKP